MVRRRLGGERRAAGERLGSVDVLADVLARIGVAFVHQLCFQRLARRRLVDRFPSRLRLGLGLGIISFGIAHRTDLHHRSG